MNRQALSHLPPPIRIVQHIAMIGLLGATGFFVGKIAFPDSSLRGFQFAGLVVLGYVLTRLMLRVADARSQRLIRLQESRESARQAEALASLNSLIDPVRPLPPTRSWAMSPDSLCQIANLVLTQKPTVVLEASSGVSTIVIAYCLKQLGRGSVVSLEQGQPFAESSRQNIIDHGLQEFALVINAPLTNHQVNGEPVYWYDLSGIESIGMIELFVIDGPTPENNTDNYARAPALPLLFDRLASQCKIFLDDADREGERHIVQDWIRQFPALTHQYIECEKGASILTKK